MAESPRKDVNRRTHKKRGRPKKTPAPAPRKNGAIAAGLLLSGFLAGFLSAKLYYGPAATWPAAEEKGTAAVSAIPPSPLPAVPKSMKLRPLPGSGAASEKGPPVPGPRAVPEVPPSPDPLPETGYAASSIRETPGPAVPVEISVPGYPPEERPEELPPAAPPVSEIAMAVISPDIERLPAALPPASLPRKESGPMDGFILVSGGAYYMGNEHGFKYEKPVRRIEVADFFISPKEVTRELWKSAMGSLPTEGAVHREAGKSLFGQEDNSPGDPGRSVDFITWYEAAAFCNALSRSEGLDPAYRIFGDRVEWNRRAGGYRLPSEEEWEYAAREGRLGRGFRFSGTSQPTEVARFNLPPEAGPAAPGTLIPNMLGIYDMSGNVAEWCWNVFLPYGEEEKSEGSEGGALNRSARGGSWMSDSGSVTVSARFGLPPNARQRGVGLRLARNRSGPGG